MFQCTYNGFVLQYYQLTCIILLYMDIQYHFSAVPALLLHQRGAAPLFFSLWSRTVLMWWEMFLMWLWTSLKSDIWLDFITMCFFCLFFFPPVVIVNVLYVLTGVSEMTDVNLTKQTNKKRLTWSLKIPPILFFFGGGGINYFFWVTLKDKPSLHRSFVIYCRTRKSSCWRNVDVKNLLFIYFGLHLYPDLYFLREKGGGGTST